MPAPSLADLRTKSAALRARSREIVAAGRNSTWRLVLKKAVRAKRNATALRGTV